MLLRVPFSLFSREICGFQFRANIRLNDEVFVQI